MTRDGLPVPAVTVRRARPTDLGAAELVFAAAPAEYTRLAGSAERARRILALLWERPGHSVSFEHAIVAELDGELAGVLIAFAARDRYRLHARLLLASLPRLSPRRWPLILAGLPAIVLASPHTPRDAYYVGTISVASFARRRGVASTLGHYLEGDAGARGFARIAVHTGTRHRPARSALEKYGLDLRRARARGYALYEKPVEFAVPVEHADGVRPVAGVAP